MSTEEPPPFEEGYCSKTCILPKGHEGKHTPFPKIKPPEPPEAE